MYHFTGKWITDKEFCSLSPRNVFFRQLSRINLPCEEHRNRHILFRKKFTLSHQPESARIYITADDYYKLYLNGQFVAQGPAPSYHFQYNYNEIDITPYLQPGENIIAVHTLYQGLINRVWQSGDLRHGMLLDLITDGQVIVCSDESFLTAPHSGYREIGTSGYLTQYLEEYDSNAKEVNFFLPDFDDSSWEPASLHTCDDHIPVPQQSKMLVFEKIRPVSVTENDRHLQIDFGANHVGYLCITATGRRGDTVCIRCGQELNDDGTVRYELRANCRYEETWILGDGESTLDQFDYKAFRFVELLLPEHCSINEIYLSARHYPFTLQAELREEYKDNKDLRRIWNLCVHTQKYGVQEVIQDCMEREKGFYVGDGCYTALTNMLLTGDDSIVRKLINDGFSSSFITEGLVTCLNCSFMQEIAEYPLMMIYLVLWHYRLTEDREYLALNYPKVTALLDSYRKDYEKDGLLCDLDKWCVVEWPMNFQDDYDVDIKEGKICHEPHVSINAYYIEAVRTANQIAKILSLPPYRNENYLVDAFLNAFYDKERHLFTDGVRTDHTSIVGNSFPFAFRLCPDKECEDNIIQMFLTRKISAVSFFCTFPVLMGFVRCGREDLVKEMLLDEGAWLRMLKEDATTTFEGWGRDTKWNTSLFHMTMSFAAVFLSDTDLKKLFV